MAPFAVGLALLSAVLTFVVLTGLTPIEPTREVILAFMLINGAAILVLVGIIIREGPAPGTGRGQASHPDRQPVLGDRGVAGGAGGGCR